MKIIKTYFLLLILSIVVTGCSSLKEINDMSRLSPEEIEIVTCRARKEIAEKIKLTKEELDTVNSQMPNVGYYVISGKGYTQYFVTWKLDNALEVTYEGLGDIKSDTTFRRIHYGEWSPKSKY